MRLLDTTRNPALTLGLRLMFIAEAVVIPLLIVAKILIYDSWEEKQNTLFYSVPMVFAFFLWLFYRMHEVQVFDTKWLWTDVLVIFLSASRLLGWFWHSGHVLFLVYALLTTKSKLFRGVAILLLGLTAYYKFFVWQDFITPLIGIIIALPIVYWYNRYDKSPVKEAEIL